MDITPQEIEVWYILPAIRKEITMSLKEEKLKQKEIASLLGLTESAVSQYIKSKRAQSVLFNQDMKTEIKNSAQTIKEDPNKIQFEIQRLLALVRESDMICKTHKQFGQISEDCNVCIKLRN
jgi:predicted transcriptional regulator